jgi:hypothetical protein
MILLLIEFLSLRRRSKKRESIMLGPLTILKVKGSLCPCLATPQESTANQALSVLSNLPVQFCLKNNNSNNDSNNQVGKFVTSLFNRASNAASAVGGGEYIKGNMNIIDSIRGPILSFEENDIKGTNMPDMQGDEYNDDGADDKQRINSEKKDCTIQLKRIADIESIDSFISSSNAGIIIYKKKKKRGPMNNNDDSEKIELIRFNICTLNPFDSNDDQMATSEERDEIMDHLRVIIEWEKERRKLQPQEHDAEEEEDEEEGKRSNGLGQKALKAKYFIQKEIEMKKLAKDRESRKAKYMKDSGGLKYTALAMANREG